MNLTDETRFERTGTILECSMVPWDSEIFGVPVAQVSRFELGGQAESAVVLDGFEASCASRDVHLVSCRLDHMRLPESMALEERGFRFVETVYGPRFDAFEAIAEPKHVIRVQEAAEADVARIEDVAYSSFSTGRFLLDQRLPPGLSRRRYATWVRTSFGSEQQVVLKAEVGGDLIGFFIVEHRRDRSVYWHLTAIAPDWQGVGMGLSLWQTMLLRHKAEGASFIETTISGHNLPALNLYARLGFTFGSAQMTAHWLRQAIQPEVSTMIPFNKPYMTGRELTYIAQAHANGHLAGNGAFSKRCCAWLEERVGSQKALLTHSCTAALEMAAILSGVGPGDEVIMPSFTFVSTANAFVLRGATPVFVDIEPATLNIDSTRIEGAITPRTKAIVPVHYAGVGCDMDTIMAIADRHDLLVIEDAAQGLLASYQDRPLGGIGHMAALSFHETKNIISGEGGALLINDARFVDRAEIVWEKGTNRSQFFRGQVDKYTWVDLGSSYLPGEIIAAFLWAQMEEAETITARRLAIWDRYHAAFEGLERSGRVRRPIVPDDRHQNGHLYYLLLPGLTARTAFIDPLREHEFQSVFHYVALHSSPFGRTVGRVAGDMANTDDISDRLVRLPLWLGLEDHLDGVIDAVLEVAG